MDLQIKNKLIAVGGATAGLGRAIAEQLLAEGAQVIGIARSHDQLQAMAEQWDGRFEGFRADFTDNEDVDRLIKKLDESAVYGICFNAGGPPPKPLLETDMEAWDAAYQLTLRWKIKLAKSLLPGMLQRQAGRMVFVESVSIKQPINNLVLSNAFRAAVAGFVRSLANENGGQGVTFNIVAPGYHATHRITAVLQQAADLQGISLQEAEAQFVEQVPVGALGEPADLASLVAWLMSSNSRYLTGQTITVDGGLVRHITG
ncbi:MAG: SDR family oxidoreductase [Bacteroidota bacterium]